MGGGAPEGGGGRGAGRSGRRGGRKFAPDHRINSRARPRASESARGRPGASARLSVSRGVVSCGGASRRNAPERILPRSLAASPGARRRRRASQRPRVPPWLRRSGSGCAKARCGEGARRACTARVGEGITVRSARGKGSASTEGCEARARSAGVGASASTGGSEAIARSAGAQASASTGGCDTSARSAGEQASASTGGGEASARSAGVGASASTGGCEARARSAGARPSADRKSVV